METHGFLIKTENLQQAHLLVIRTDKLAVYFACIEFLSSKSSFLLDPIITAIFMDTHKHVLHSL